MATELIDECKSIRPDIAWTQQGAAVVADLGLSGRAVSVVRRDGGYMVWVPVIAPHVSDVLNDAKVTETRGVLRPSLDDAIRTAEWVLLLEIRRVKSGVRHLEMVHAVLAAPKGSSEVGRV